MRIFSHTCSNTEIVCALGCADLLVGVDADSDYPPEIVDHLPKPGRDLDLDTAAALALKPDLILTSLTVPGHERIVDEFKAAGLQTLTLDPQSLEDVYANVHEIAAAIGVVERGRQLVDELRQQMPAVQTAGERPRVLVEWWPKPVIAAAQRSWVNDLITLAGGINACGAIDAKSQPLEENPDAAYMADIVVISWCGVQEAKYRPEIVQRRPYWQHWPALQNRRIYPITEAWLGRPGPRLVHGYAALRSLIAAV